MKKALALLCLSCSCLLAGAVWLCADLWNGFEHSELVGIPYRPLRVALVLTLLVLLLHALRRLWHRVQS